MRENKSNNYTVKYLVLILLSVWVGTFVGDTLTKTEMNFWITRVIGALVTGGVAVIIYNLWIRKNKK